MWPCCQAKTRCSPWQPSPAWCAPPHRLALRYSAPPSPRPLPVVAAEAVEALVAQVSSPVRWEDVVRRLASEGVTTYVEVGPGTVLSGLVRKIHREATVASFGTPDDLVAEAQSIFANTLVAKDFLSIDITPSEPATA